MIPWLYLKGVSTGDFSEALSALVGPDAHGLSASTITRLKEVWEGEFQEWTWKHLRTTNPIESTFATVRLRHRRTKGSGSRSACMTMVFKIMQSAAKRWRLLNGSQHLADVNGANTFSTASTQSPQ